MITIWSCEYYHSKYLLLYQSCHMRVLSAETLSSGPLLYLLLSNREWLGIDCEQQGWQIISSGEYRTEKGERHFSDDYIRVVKYSFSARKMSLGPLQYSLLFNVLSICVKKLSNKAVNHHIKRLCYCRNKFLDINSF